MGLISTMHKNPTMVASLSNRFVSQPNLACEFGGALKHLHRRCWPLLKCVLIGDVDRAFGDVAFGSKIRTGMLIELEMQTEGSRPISEIKTEITHT